MYTIYSISNNSQNVNVFLCFYYFLSIFSKIANNVDKSIQVCYNVYKSEANVLFRSLCLQKLKQKQGTSGKHSSVTKFWNLERKLWKAMKPIRRISWRALNNLQPKFKNCSRKYVFQRFHKKGGLIACYYDPCEEFIFLQTWVNTLTLEVRNWKLENKKIEIRASFN